MNVANYAEECSEALGNPSRLHILLPTNEAARDVDLECLLLLHTFQTSTEATHGLTQMNREGKLMAPALAAMPTTATAVSTLSFAKRLQSLNKNLVIGIVDESPIKTDNGERAHPNDKHRRALQGSLFKCVHRWLDEDAMIIHMSPEVSACACHKSCHYSTQHEKDISAKILVISLSLTTPPVAFLITWPSSFAD